MEPALVNVDPHVRFARVWEWSGFWSFLLAVLEQVMEELQAIPGSWYVRIALVALPVVIRWVRQKVTGIKASFRRTEPPAAAA